jgi:hypothetical protein
MRWVIGVAALAAAGVLCSAYVVYPFWTLEQIGGALEAKDSDAAAPFIDWTKVRDGLRADVGMLMMQAGPGKAESPGMQAISRAIGTVVTDRMVDTLVSPAGLQRVLKASSELHKHVEPKLVWARFSTPTILRFQVKPVPEAELVLTGTLELQGVTWRVTRIVVPEEITRDSLQEEQNLGLQQAVGPGR